MNGSRSFVTPSNMFPWICPHWHRKGPLCDMLDCLKLLSTLSRTLSKFELFHCSSSRPNVTVPERTPGIVCPSLMPISPEALLQLEADVLKVLVVFGWKQLIELVPRGLLTHAGASLEVRASTVAGAGRGIFTTEPIAKGMVLGAYPGRITSHGDMAHKLKRLPHAAEYCWSVSSTPERDDEPGFILDPTDSAGNLCEPLCLIPRVAAVYSTPITLALINVNEPPRGRDVNVDAIESFRDVFFVALREMSKRVKSTF